MHATDTSTVLLAAAVGAVAVKLKVVDVETLKLLLPSLTGVSMTAPASSEREVAPRVRQLTSTVPPSVGSDVGFIENWSMRGAVAREVPHAHTPKARGAARAAVA